MNKTLIITGGSKGIGRSIAMKFAENNFDIYTCSRNTDELKTLESQTKTFFNNSPLIGTPKNPSL